MSQVLENLRWVPRLCVLAMTNRVGVRIKQGREYLFIATASEATKNNGIVRVELLSSPAATVTNPTTELDAARKKE